MRRLRAPSSDRSAPVAPVDRVALLVGSSAVPLVSTAAWLFWYVHGPEAGLRMAAGAGLLFAPLIILLAAEVGRLVGSAPLDPDRPPAPRGRPGGARLGRVLVAPLLAAQVLLWLGSDRFAVEPPRTRAQISAMKAGLEMLVEHQDAHHSEFDTYTTRFPADFRPPAGVTLLVGSAHSTAWNAIAVYGALEPGSWRCVVSVGEGGGVATTALGLTPGASGEVACDGEGIAAAVRLQAAPPLVRDLLVRYYVALERRLG